MHQAPYGSWPSPITVAALTSPDVRRLGEPRFDGADRYWVEGRPAERGRTALLRERDGELTEVAPGFNVRTRVHEYGGGAFDVRDGVVVFSEFTTGRVHRVDADAAPPITPESTELRYADLRVWPEHDVVLAVREDHGDPAEPVNTLVVLDLHGDNADGGRVLVSGADFYACPELGPGGELAWMEWSHPAMPWDSCRVRRATLLGAIGELRLGEPTTVAGGPGESAVHPQWRAGELLYLSDRSGFWELYADDRRLTRLEADLAEPFWVFGRRPYGVLADGRVLLRPRIDGYSRPLLLDGAESVDLGLDVVDIDSIDVAGDEALALAQFADRPAAVVSFPIPEPGRRGPVEARIVRASSEAAVPEGSISRAEAVGWTSPLGDVHGWFYAPANGDVTAPKGELPPLIVMSHGGPTAFATAGFDIGVQFWTSRGFAVLDVNYGGSSGYGRAYRQRLNGQWGVVDVRDCVAGALALAAQGRVDPRRLLIRGGSAGGYTTLRALTTSTVFAAGTSLYGIGDLAALAADTHKFESRYTDGLVGPWPAAADVYAARSPIHHMDALNCPMLILQGADDQVVPRNQAEAMAAAVRAKGLHAELIVFDGEGHGFRQAASIERARLAELAFYGRVLGFTPAP